MDDNQKINFLLNTCKINSTRFPHTLLITEDCTLSEKFAGDLANTLMTNLITINTSSNISIGDLAGTLTSLQKNDIILLQEINSLNKETLYYFYNIMENFALDILIDSGPNARSVRVKLNEFTIIGTSNKLQLIPRKLISSFFCIIQGDEIKEIGIETIYKFLKNESINASTDVAEYIFSVVGSNKIEIKYFLKNLLNFLTISRVGKNSILTINLVNDYLNFFGISKFNEGNLVTRQISAEVKREVWRRDEGKCIICESQERLEFDHIIPFSKGGSNTVRNIQLLCENCNRTKSAKI